MKKYRRSVAYGAIVLSAVVLAAALDAAGELTGLRGFEDFTLDLRQQTTPESFQAGRSTRDSDVALVLFDEYSVMDTIDGWPWLSPFPRAHLAELVDALAAAGARTIGVDVYLDRLFPGLNEIDRGDELLRDAIARAGNVILVTPVAQTDSGPVMTPPHRYFAEVAAGIGSAELPASFETFRDGTLAVRSGYGVEPSFALALYAHFRGLDMDSLLRAAADAGRLDLPGLPSSVGHIPSKWLEDDPASEGAIVPFRIRYVGPPSVADADGPPGTFQSSASGTVPDLAAFLPELFRDKVVLLGTGFHEQDRFRTPFYSYRAPDGEAYGWMYGVEVHANALQNMLDTEYVRPTGTAARLLLLLLVAAVAGGAAFRLGAGWGAVTTLVAALGTLALAWWVWAGVVYVPGAELFAFGSRFRWLPVGAPFVSGLLAYVGSVAYVAVVEGRDKRRIKGAFAKYVSPDVVNEIAEDPDALRLGGQKRALTILFSDLTGFTTLSEKMDPENLVTLLNEYLDDMTQVVLEEGGTLDKYIGDAVMAFWNAPKAYPDHAERAMRAAVAMQRHMAALNRRWGGPSAAHGELTMRIGIHTGEVVVGNLGGEGRFAYSAIGDAVNLAARLEPANKTYDTYTMVSEATLQAAGDATQFRVRELDIVAVKGKSEPAKVYELLELAGVPLPEGKEEALRWYDQGMAAYKRHEWNAAKAHFEAALAADPNDGPSRLYAARCEANIADPPPTDWDFVVRRQEK